MCGSHLKDKGFKVAYDSTPLINLPRYDKGTDSSLARLARTVERLKTPRWLGVCALGTPFASKGEMLTGDSEPAVMELVDECTVLCMVMSVESCESHNPQTYHGTVYSTVGGCNQPKVGRQWGEPFSPP